MPSSDTVTRTLLPETVREGFRTRVLTDLCAGVASQTTEAALAEMRRAGAQVG